MSQRKRLNQENIYNLMKNPVADLMKPIELPTNEPIGLYGRQSSLFQVQNNTASNDYQINEQRRILIYQYKWSEKLIIEYFDDFAFSGTLGIGERVGITNLVEDIEAGIIKAVYVFLEDRLFRDRHLENVVKFARICFERKIYIITNYRIYRMWLDADKNDFIEACKRAWEQFDTQINKRMIPMRAYKAHAGYYDSRGINIGYIVDKDKKSPTYNRYIIYEPHAEVIRWIYRRFIELSGSLALLGDELEQQTVHFRWYEDTYFNKRCPLMKVPGVGYRIGTWKTLKAILTNKVYIGVWKAGDEEHPGNHTAIIDIVTWETVQELMEARAAKTQPITRKELSVLSGLIDRPAPGYTVSIERESETRARKAITFSEREYGLLYASKTDEIHYEIVEDTYREALTRYIEREDQFIEYAREATQLYEREEKNKRHIQETIGRLRARHDNLYNEVTDHTLQIPKEAKRKMYEEMSDLETEITRLETVLKQKKTNLDFPTLIELIGKVKEHWKEIPVDLLHDLATIFTKGIRLTAISPHMWEMCIKWKIWGEDTYIIWQSYQSHLKWTGEEEQTLKRMLEEKRDVQEILDALPRFSYDSIYTKCKRDCDKFGIEVNPFSFQGWRLDSCLTEEDREIIARYNIPMEEIARLKNMTTIGRDKQGNTYYRRALNGKIGLGKDGAFFMGHKDINEELEGNSEGDRFTSAP
jgi:hypothetical protein